MDCAHGRYYDAIMSHFFGRSGDLEPPRGHSEPDITLLAHDNPSSHTDPNGKAR
jgi:hypothetical protein